MAKSSYTLSGLKFRLLLGLHGFMVRTKRAKGAHDRAMRAPLKFKLDEPQVSQKNFWKTPDKRKRTSQNQLDKFYTFN